MLLKDKNIFITGSNRGIGKAILEKCASEGANIISHTRKDNLEYRKMIEIISNKYGVKIFPIFFDLTDVELIKQETKKIIKEIKRIDVLVNCAGVAHGAFFQMTPIDKIKEIFEINLFAQMQLTQIVMKTMIRQTKGSIINISSVSGIDLLEGNCAYGVSKAAFIAFTKVLANECGKYNIRVNTIAPGLINTEMFALIEAKAKTDLLKSSSIGRMGTTDEVADLTVFLSSDKSSFINGQTIRIDGGMS